MFQGLEFRVRTPVIRVSAPKLHHCNISRSLILSTIGQQCVIMCLPRF